MHIVKFAWPNLFSKYSGVYFLLLLWFYPGGYPYTIEMERNTVFGYENGVFVVSKIFIPRKIRFHSKTVYCQGKKQDKCQGRFRKSPIKARILLTLGFMVSSTKLIQLFTVYLKINKPLSKKIKDRYFSIPILTKLIIICNYLNNIQN